MIVEHLAAVRSLLAGLTVHDDLLPEPQSRASYPAVVLRAAFRDEAALTVMGAHDSVTFRFATTCAGLTGESARIYAGKVAESLRDVRPSVAGRVCGPIHLAASSGQPAPDLDVQVADSTSHPAFLTDVWQFASDPA